MINDSNLNDWSVLMVKKKHVSDRQSSHMFEHVFIYISLKIYIKIKVFKLWHGYLSMSLFLGQVLREKKRRLQWLRMKLMHQIFLRDCSRVKSSTRCAPTPYDRNWGFHWILSSPHCSCITRRWRQGNVNMTKIKKKSFFIYVLLSATDF